jgi:hypothetical protein
VPSRDLAIEANGRRLPCPGVVSTRRGATTDPCGSRAPRVTRARIVFGRRSEEPSVRTDRYERRPCSRLVWGTTTFPFGRSRVLVRTSAERSFGNRTGIFGVWLAAAGTAAIDCFRERIEARHTRLREHLHPRHAGGSRRDSDSSRRPTIQHWVRRLESRAAEGVDGRKAKADRRACHLTIHGNHGAATASVDSRPPRTRRECGGRLFQAMMSHLSTASSNGRSPHRR